MERSLDLDKANTLYRAQHSVMRDTRKLMLDISAIMDGYLSQSDWRVNENANVNYSLGGLILHNSGSITANYWLKKVYPPEIAEAHINETSISTPSPCSPATVRGGRSGSSSTRSSEELTGLTPRGLKRAV